MKRISTAAAAVAVSLLAACGTGGEGTPVSREAFEGQGMTWPLTLDEGSVSCEPGNRALFTDPQGATYALNGLSNGDGRWLDIEPIWAPDPEVDGLKVGIGDLIEEALKLC